MKVVILTLLLVAFMLTATVANGTYINNVTDSLLRMLEDLPSPEDTDCSLALLRVREEWEARVAVIRLSAGYSNRDRVEEQIELLISCQKRGDVFGYYNALTLLKDALEDLRRYEILAPEGWV